MEITEKLLKKVSDDIAKYEDEKNKTSEGFNFFKVLGIETRETYHSKFIAELLNPNGLHNCKKLFLNVFLDLLSDELRISIENNSAGSVITERFLGEIPADYSKGGYVDIYLKVNQQVFLVENKINAGDQQNQIIRYHQHKIEEKDNYSSCHILYLTLDGKCPTIYSSGSLQQNEHFHCISYKTHIVKWLLKCIDICDRPTVKETIKGYLTVIKYLTNQTSYHIMQDEIKNLLLANKTYLNAATELSNIVAIIKNEADEKVREINRLLKIYDFDKKIGQIEVGDHFDYNGRVFYIKIHNSEIIEIEVGTDDGVLYCGGNAEFPNCNGLIEPYTAGDFVNAIIEDLNQKYSSI
jgi:hypothetical protein